MRIIKEEIKGKIKVIEAEFWHDVFAENIRIYIIKKADKNGIFREIRRMNKGNTAMSEIFKEYN